MSITRQAIEKNRVTTVALIVIILAGLQTFFTLPQAEDPGFTIRTALIQTFLPGASPERVEMLITDKIEKAVQEIPELDFVNSISKTGVSLVFVNIKERYFNMRPIWDSMRRKVDRARSELPEEVRGPFVNDEFGDVFGIVIGLTGEGYSYAELKVVADQVRDELLRNPDAAKVDIYGAQDERVFVEFHNARLSEVGLSPGQLRQLLSTQNIIIPGGQIYTDEEQIALEPSGNFESVEELKRTVITVPGSGELFFLEDLAHVYRGYIDPPAALMHTNGISSLGLAVSLREGGNIVTLGEQVRETMNRLRGQYPIGIEFEMIAFQPDVVTRKVNDFVGNLLQAMLLVLIVMLVTLGLRTGFLVASLIPTTILMTLLLMGVFNIGLDQVSLASLIIALGMLVDNAIVMSESIMVSLSEGKSRLQAAVESAAELRVPLLISSLTTCAAFLPIFLAESNVGEYTASLFKVVSLALISSWILALTMTPLLCSIFLKTKKAAKQEAYNGSFYRFYRSLLLKGLRFRYLTLLLTVVVFFVAMFGMGFVRQLFFPASDSPLFTAEIEMPVGTPVDKTATVITKIERYMQDSLMAIPGERDGVVNWGAWIGEGAPRYVLQYNPELSAPEYAILIVNTTTREACDWIMPQLERYCLATFPGIKPKISLRSSGPPVRNPIEVRLAGRDVDKVFSIVDDIKVKLESMHGPRQVVDNWGARVKKLVVDIDQPRARRAGLSSRDVAVSLQTALSGIATTEYREGDKVIPVTLRSVAADRQDIGKLESLNIYSQLTGRSVPLKQVADIHVDWEAAKVLRRDRLKTVTVESQLIPGVTAAEVVAELKPWLEQESGKWGLGYEYEIGGESEEAAESNKSIGEKLPIAFMIIILLLVLQFNSIRKPIIVLSTIPLALIGVVVGLLVLDSYFGFMTLLGIISLAGIVINNAIVLLDRIRIEIEENGLEPQRAIIVAAQRRLRPILLTTATTIGGLLPLYFGGGPMWEPMAVAIMFGLLFSTMLTLGFVPVFYSILYRVNFRGFRF